MKQFPSTFLWGAASSGPQSEGSFNKPHDSVMDAWFKKRPEDFFDRVGPDIASDSYHHYDSDFEQMKECGFNSYRTSIQWARLIRNLETGEADEDGVQYYRNLIQSAKAHGIRLIINLHHFDLPEELLETYGGWTNRHVVDLYVSYAKTAFELFGKDVDLWTTFNEPMVIPECGYLDGIHWPKYKQRGKDAVQIMYHLNLASSLAIQEYRRQNHSGKIGIILNLTPAYPRSNDPADLQASAFVEDFYNRFFLDPAVYGTFPRRLCSLLEEQGVLFSSSESDTAVFKNNTVDFLGINYYHPRRVKARETPLIKGEWTPAQYFEDYEKPGIRINPYRGWEIYPEALYEIAHTIQTEYGNLPWYVSENGMGVEDELRFADEAGIIHDHYRINFYNEHLAQLHRAIEEGSACFGFHAWTSVDCWSWNNAYKNRYGFISVDLKTQARTIKDSGRWFHQLATTGVLEDDS
ncbi:MAG: glycoside hydrolase family 1 protein [Solobacterium sp.]|nr:glycoside hydrolase family 1 protein [Solobacterium sp.]